MEGGGETSVYKLVSFRHRLVVTNTSPQSLTPALSLESQLSFNRMPGLIGNTHAGSSRQSSPSQSENSDQGDSPGTIYDPSALDHNEACVNDDVILSDDFNNWDWAHVRSESAQTLDDLLEKLNASLFSRGYKVIFLE